MTKQLDNNLQKQKENVYYQLEQEAKSRGFENRAEKMEFERYKAEDIELYKKIYNEEVEPGYYDIKEVK